jgi:hypothetical protein
MKRIILTDALTSNLNENGFLNNKSYLLLNYTQPLEIIYIL